jgi:hypothetical protein
MAAVLAAAGEVFTGATVISWSARLCLGRRGRDELATYLSHTANFSAGTSSSWSPRSPPEALIRRTVSLGSGAFTAVTVGALTCHFEWPEVAVTDPSLPWLIL